MQSAHVPVLLIGAAVLIVHPVEAYTLQDLWHNTFSDHAVSRRRQAIAPYLNEQPRPRRIIAAPPLQPADYQGLTRVDSAYGVYFPPQQTATQTYVNRCN